MGCYEGRQGYEAPTSASLLQVLYHRVLADRHRFTPAEFSGTLMGFDDYVSK